MLALWHNLALDHKAVRLALTVWPCTQYFAGFSQEDVIFGCTWKAGSSALDGCGSEKEWMVFDYIASFSSEYCMRFVSNH
tara:strand:+ start:468 stop:707 length:240 start_codon:yes stop_codon:yes gene_type:complete